MVNSEELAQLQVTENKGILVKMATVTELFENGTAKIMFYGEDTASEKEYSYLASYTPTIGDMVILLPILDTYIIMGKVLYKETQDTDGGQNEDNVNLENYITKEELTSRLNSYAASSHTHDVLYWNGCSFTLVRYSNGTFCFEPSASGKADLGTSSYKMKNIYATNGTISTSDAREKGFISLVKDDKRYIRLFWMLIPKAYKMKSGTNGRTHVGFYSQDIEDAMEICELDSNDFAGFIKSPVYKEDEDGNETEEIIDYAYGLRYEEFHAIEVAVIQDMNERLLKVEGLQNG